jgi:transposase
MTRRRYSREFKVSAVRLVTEEGCSVPQAAKNLGVDLASLRTWLKKFTPGAGNAPVDGPGRGACRVAPFTRGESAADHDANVPQPGRQEHNPLRRLPTCQPAPVGS